MSTTLIEIQWMCASIKEAETIGNALLTKKLVACINIIPEMQSLFEWEGELQKEKEVQMQCKTIEARAKEVIAYIEKHASYDIPAIYGFPLHYVNDSYAQWVQETVG